MYSFRFSTLVVIFYRSIQEHKSQILIISMPCVQQFFFFLIHTDLPVFVMIISVPSSLNLSHRSLVSSRQLTCCRSSELHRSSRTGSAAAVTVAAVVDDGRGGGLDVDDDMITSSPGEARAERTVVVMSLLRRRLLCGFPSKAERIRKTKSNIILF